MKTDTTASLIYAAAYPIYRDLGWPVIKLPTAKKFPPPKGFTGRDGSDPSGADLHAWAEQEPTGNIAIRLPADMIGIDCDNYGDKYGAATIAEAEKRWGRLPYSPRSTSRDDSHSGIRLYRIPAGIELVEKLTFPELGLGGVEIIQRHHRYVVAWPSVHDKTGQLYRWLGIDTGPLDNPPARGDIPDLPAPWVEGLQMREKVCSTTELGPDIHYNVYDALTEGEASRRVSWRLGEAILSCEGQNRHDDTRDHVLALLRYGKQGDGGVTSALRALHKAFIAAVEKDRPGGCAQADKEFRDFIEGRRAARLLAEPDYKVEQADAEADIDQPRLAGALLNRTALRELPDPEPLIDNVLDQGSVALLYGQWGTGKSFIAYDWAASVATGRAWQGRPTEERRVLYVAAEGAFGLKARTDAWEVGWHTPISDEQLVILPQAVNLTAYAEVRDLAALIAWGGYGLVVIDTLARCMVGADENSAKDCGQVVDALTRLREHTTGKRGVVIGVHHTGKDGKTFRGSSVFEAGADTVYSVIRDGGVIVLDREKRKDGPKVDTHRLRLDPVEGTMSCVISAGNLSSPGVDRSDRAQRLLSTFVHHFVHTGATKAELRTVADMPPATFHRALSDLITSGDLVNEGTDQRPFYKGATQ